MRARPGHLRIALAVLALVGQLTPAVALPLAKSAKLPNARVGGCGAPAAECACSAIARATAACCCSEPAPKPEPPKPKKVSCCDAIEAPKKVKSCCELPPKPKPAEAVAAKPKPAPTPHAARIVAGGKCKCEKPAPVANAEPAAPHAHADHVAHDAASAPHGDRRATAATPRPLPPPYPPPRA